MDLTDALRRLSALVARARADVESRRLASCSGCPAPCCRVGRNGMLVSPLEAAGILRRIETDAALARRRRALVEEIESLVAARGLSRTADRETTYDCPFLIAGGGCAVHGEGQPLGCVTFMPATPDQEHCDQDEEAFVAAYDELAALNESVFGDDWEPWPIPVAVLDRLRRLKRKNAVPEKPDEV